MNEENLCEVCCENELWNQALAHGENLCEKCSEEHMCHRCECGSFCQSLGYVWDPCICADCQQQKAKYDFLDSTEASVRNAAEANDWSEDENHTAETATRYLTFSRRGETVKIRISDHASCYCSENYSLVPAGRESGDDHSLDQVLARLAQPANEESDDK